VEVSFLEYLRPEKKFDGLAQLKEQIGRDAAVAREIYQGRRR
jgi:FAD synthase